MLKNLIFYAAYWLWQARNRLTIDSYAAVEDFTAMSSCIRALMNTICHKAILALKNAEVRKEEE